MDFEKEMKSLVRQSVMEEINNLGVRAAIKERITETGITDGELRLMVAETVDSHFRSAIGDNEDQIKARIDRMLAEKIDRIAEKEVAKIIGTLNSWRGSEKVEQMIVDAMRRVVADNFQVSVNITRK